MTKETKQKPIDTTFKFWSDIIKENEDSAWKYKAGVEWMIAYYNKKLNEIKK